MTTVPDFLIHLQESAPWQHELFLELRKLVFACFPATTERIIYGGIMFALDGEDYGGTTLPASRCYPTQSACLV